MSSLTEIERAISTLSPSELDELYLWMDEHCPLDVQLQKDLQSGRMDERISHALAEHSAGNTRLL